MMVVKVMLVPDWTKLPLIHLGKRQVPERVDETAAVTVNTELLTTVATV